ncbi:hypothetical protein [Olleya sp. HaHaR_3_96]|uniref:hypothetical protein n=1 Tax=Olleya sp. HaHaR_3_96 TaxID=2745560 RepID=UPI001C4E3A44|nr:hypothetical protein [Olleya sp. HaHaR_3_96]QXP60266.1 hypothetical protein H0I26_01080 [Olleya sp. HaHaR_3_96]
MKNNYLFKKEYEKFNDKIIKVAKGGDNFVMFDFVDKELDGSDILSDLRRNHKRIYFSSTGGQATHNMLESPLYLISKGFKVEIRESQNTHGYPSKTYFISW